MNRLTRTMLVGSLSFLGAQLALFAQGPVPMPTPPGAISNMSLVIHAVGNLDKSVKFYQDVFGFETTTPVPAKPAVSEYIQNLLDVHQGEFRSVRLKITGAEFPLALTEFTGLERKQVDPNHWDPGSMALVFRVRDLDKIYAAVPAAGGKIISTGVKILPAGAQGGTNSIMVRDPDGFILEVINATPEQLAANTKDRVIKATISITGTNQDQMKKFYKEMFGFGLEDTRNSEFHTNAGLLSLIGSPVGSVRSFDGTVPGSTTVINFREFKDVKRTPFHPRPSDPGAPILTLASKDVPGLLASLKAKGVKVISTGGVPSNNNVTVEDPDGLRIEIVQSR